MKPEDSPGKQPDALDPKNALELLTLLELFKSNNHRGEMPSEAPSNSEEGEELSLIHISEPTRPY